MDENYLDNLLDGFSSNNSKVNNDFEKRMDKDSDIDFDLDDLSDISLDELDDLDNLDLGDLDLDDIDFDDLDVTNLDVKKQQKADEDFNLDSIVEETSEPEEEDVTELLGGFSNGDDVFSDADNELMNDVGMPGQVESQSLEELMRDLDISEDELMANNTDYEATSTPIANNEATGFDGNDSGNEPDFDAMGGDDLNALLNQWDNEDSFEQESAPQDVDNMNIDDLFSALGIDDGAPAQEENYVKNEGELDDLFENASLDQDLLGDIQDISEPAPSKQAKKKKKKSADGEDGEKTKKTLSEILFGEPDEEDIEEEKQRLIEKEKKKVLKEEKKTAKEEKKAEKAAMLEMKKKDSDKAKKEKAEKKKAELEAELEEEKGQKQVPTPVVIIVFLAFALLGGLVYFGAQYFHYSEVIRKATDYFERQRYRLAYDEVSGVDVKKQDEELRDRIYTVMYVERLYESYENNMSLGRPDKALDALLRGCEKYEEHYDEAVELDIVEDIDYVMSKIELALMADFGLTLDQAHEIIELEGQDYIQAVVKCCERYDTGE